MNTNGSELKRLTNNPAYDGWPKWSPDGEKIAFETDREKDYGICVMNSDGSGLRNLTTNNTYRDRWPCWSPDGKKIAFSAFKERNSDKEKISEICILDLDRVNN
jgi:TolB protein